MSSNLQPPSSSSDSTSPYVAPDATSASPGGVQEKKAVVVNGQVVIVDTSSSATGDQKGVPSNADPSNPMLTLDSNNMTSAQMYAMGITIMDQARKQRLRTEAEADAIQYQLTWGLRMGISDTTVTVPPTNSKSSGSGSTNSTNSSLNASANATADGSAQTQSASTQTSTQSTTTKTNTASDSPHNVTIQTLDSEIAGLITLQTTLSSALEQVAKKQNVAANPLSPNAEQEAFNSTVKQFIDAYVHNLVAAGNLNALGPAELFLKVPGLNALDLDSKTVGAATAVGFSEYVMGLVNSGDIDKFASSYIFPNDPASAKAFSANVSSILLDFSLEQVGTALNMQGLTDQVEAQAKLVRDQSDILSDPAKLQPILEAIAQNNAQTSGISAKQIEATSSQAVQDVMSKGPYNTTQDLLTALQSGLKASAALNKALAEDLANQIFNSSLDEAIGKRKYPFPPLPITPGNINFVMLQTSIQNTMERDFSKSDREVRQAKKDQDAVKSIVADVVQKQYKNELDVRNDIKNQLLDKIPDITDEQAADIAAHADLGIKHNGPLYNRGDDNILPPDVFNQNIQIGYQSIVHAAPDSDFGKAIEHVTGLQTGFDGTNMISLINQNYQKGNTETRSYLNLPASEQVKVQQQRIFDPGAQLVLAWGSVINGISGTDKDHPPSVSIAI